MGKDIMKTRSQHQRRQSKHGVELMTQEQILNEIEDADSEMTSSMALYSLHQFIKQHRITNIDKFRRKATQILKICKICDKWDRLNTIMSCQKCEDNYHQECFKPTKKSKTDGFVCLRCSNPQIQFNKCKVCQKNITKGSKVIVCQYCSHEYHPECMQKLKKICRKCVTLRALMGLSNKTKNIKKEEKWKNQIIQSNQNLRDMLESIKLKKDTIASTDSLFKRKGCYFKAMTVLDGKNDKMIQKYKNSLLNAIKAKAMSYTEDLHDIEFHLGGMEKKSMDFGLGNMSLQEEKQYLKYKQQPIGPFLLKYFNQKGYDVIADRDIPERSIICEYVGEVVTLHECSELDLIKKNDSIMQLWVGRNSDETLVIRPERWTNLGRFLNGVKYSHCERNVQSIRLCYRGLPVVLLVAGRNIKKGESLCYDYNAGGIVAKIDTSDYV